MIDFTIRTTPTNLTQVISDLPKNLRGPATEEAALYLIGDTNRGLKHYPPYKYVSRMAAYGFTFFSDAQRRLVMAKIRSGEITPGISRRTGETARAWTVLYSGVKTRILNPTRGAYYTADDIGQSRHEAMVGWRRVSSIIASNQNGMSAAADKRAQQEIKARGL